METQEVLDLLAQLQADVEWEQSIAFAAALDIAMKRVKDWKRLKERLLQEKVGYPPSANEYKMILKVVQIMEEMENEDDKI